MKIPSVRLSLSVATPVHSLLMATLFAFAGEVLKLDFLDDDDVAARASTAGRESAVLPGRSREARFP